MMALLEVIPGRWIGGPLAMHDTHRIVRVMFSTDMNTMAEGIPEVHINGVVYVPREDKPTPRNNPAPD
jgi:hypothetical protein